MLARVYAPPNPIQRCKWLHLRAPVLAPGRTAARAGGLERYAAHLAGAWSERLHPEGVVFAARARLGGEVVRLGDGVSLAWAEAMALGRWDRWRHRRLLAAERRAFDAARAVVAISPMVAADLARWHGRTDAVVVLNPVWPQPRSPGERSPGERSPGDPSPEGAASVHPPAGHGSGPALLFVGHGFARKGLDHLLAALGHLPAARLTVVGHDRDLAGWVARTRRAGLAGRVRFVGATPAAPHLAATDLLVHPARYEPWGNAVAEAVAAGVPAVASDRTGAAWLLDPAHVWPSNSGGEALAEAIAAALRAPRPPAHQPPTVATHLAALERVIWPDLGPGPEPEREGTA